MVHAFSRWILLLQTVDDVKRLGFYWNVLMSPDAAAKIDLYVAERAVARHEAAFQRWVETVAAPLRYVCVGDGANTRFCNTPLGKYIENYGNDKIPDAPNRKIMSAFSGFSIARDQHGVWFRPGTGATDEDRVSIYTFLVAGELGRVAYYAIRERLARTILRERNEQAVLLCRKLGPTSGLEMEFVSDKTCDYRGFAQAFEKAAEYLSDIDNARIDLAWQQLHLFQLLQRDLMTWVADKPAQTREEVLRPLFNAFVCMVERTFEGRILARMSISVFATWVKIAKELKDLGDENAVKAIEPHVVQVLKASILEISDSLWRFQGHSLAAAGDLDCDSCGVEAFAFVAGINTWQCMLGLGLDGLAENHEETLRQLWTDPTYIPHLLLRDWRGLSYGLNARNRKELATAFGLRTVNALDRSGISSEREWYGFMRRMFPNS